MLDKVKAAFAKVITFVKKNWQIISIFLGSIFVMFLLGGKSSIFADKSKKIDKIHKKEVEDILEIKEKEQKQLDENRQKLDEELKEVKENYDSSLEKLEEEKKEQVEKILSDTNKDPNELAKKLSEATNFKVIMPKDD